MTTPPAKPPADFDRDLVDLSNLLKDSDDLESALHQVAGLAVRAVPGCGGAGVVVADPSGPKTLAATDPGTWAVAAFQYDRREGPGLEAIRYGEPRRIDDTTIEDRWPGFCAEATRHGWRSTLALPLRMAGASSGALSLYAAEAAVFDGLPQDLATLFAHRSAMALSNADLYFASRQLADNLHTALVSRSVIEQAKGIVMEREHCDAERAFEVLVSASQRSHQKLREVAEQVVRTAVDTASG